MKKEEKKKIISVVFLVYLKSRILLSKFITYALVDKYHTFYARALLGFFL